MNASLEVWYVAVGLAFIGAAAFWAANVLYLIWLDLADTRRVRKWDRERAALLALLRERGRIRVARVNGDSQPGRSDA